MPDLDTTEMRWDGQSKGGAWGNRSFMFLLRRFGILPAYALLCFVSLWYALTDRKAGASIALFRRHLGARAGIVDRWRHFFAFGASLIDRFAFLLSPRAPFWFTCRREDRIVELTKESKGVILLSAHVGNWELAGNLLFDRINTPVNIVALENERHDVRRVYETATRNRRVNVISLSEDHASGATIGILKALRAGEIVCLHGDRITDQRFETIEFLGEPARFPVGPFAVAAIAGSPIVPVFVVKTGVRTYDFEAHDPIRLDNVPRRERDAAIRRAMEQYVKLLERVVRRYPFQWYNFFPFW